MGHPTQIGFDIQSLAPRLSDTTSQTPPYLISQLLSSGLSRDREVVVLSGRSLGVDCTYDSSVVMLQTSYPKAPESTPCDISRFWLTSPYPHLHLRSPTQKRLRCLSSCVKKIVNAAERSPQGPIFARTRYIPQHMAPQPRIQSSPSLCNTSRNRFTQPL